MRLLALLAVFITACTNQYNEPWRPWDDHWWGVGGALIAALTFILIGNMLDRTRRIAVSTVTGLTVSTVVYSLGYMYWPFLVPALAAVIIAYFARGMHNLPTIKSAPRPARPARQPPPPASPSPKQTGSALCPRCQKVTLGETFCADCGARKTGNGNSGSKTSLLDEKLR